MNNLWNDLRLALRALANNRSFTAFAILILALGIGANSAMFSLVDNLLLRPLPVTSPAELVAIGRNATAMEAGGNTVNWQMFSEYRDNLADSFEGIAAYNENISAPILESDGNVLPAVAAVVTGNYFDLLGVRAIRGRLLTPDDDRARRDVAVLSNRTWRELFGGRADALGATLRVGAGSYSVVGVAPPDFSGVSLDSSPDVWLPISSSIGSHPVVRMMTQEGQAYFTRVVARLRPRVGISQARQQLDAIAVRLGAGQTIALGWKNESGHSVPEQWEKPRPSLDPLVTTRGGHSRDSSLLVFSGLALLLLLIVGNLASMLLARVERRRREVAIRLTLGASRLQVARPILVEGFLVSMLGALASVFVAYWSVKLLLAKMAPQMQWHTSLATSVLSPRNLIFSLLLAIFAALFFTLAPAVRASHASILSIMNSGLPAKSDGRPRAALRGGLLIFQTAMSTVLLTGTLLFLQAYRNDSHVELSYNPNRVFFFLPRAGRSFANLKADKTYWNDLLSNLNAAPGISAAFGSPFLLAGRVGMPEGRAYTCRVTPGYFSVLGTPVIRGRDFNSQDREGAPPVAIVNQTMARQFWPGKDAIGQTAKHVLKHEATVQVIGVVADVRHGEGQLPDDPTLYVPLDQFYSDYPIPLGNSLLIRSNSALGSVFATLNSTLNRFDRNASVIQGESVADYLVAPYSLEQFEAQLFGAFAIMAIVLTATGLYGLISYIVAARTRELGLRLALGASRASVLRLALRHGARLAFTGIVIGLGLEYGLLSFLSSFLRGINPAGGPTVAIVALIIFSAAIAACYVPARRASRLDPMAALRHD
jgi:predicted permease